MAFVVMLLVWVVVKGKIGWVVVVLSIACVAVVVWVGGLVGLIVKEWGVVWGLDEDWMEFLAGVWLTGLGSVGFLMDHLLQSVLRRLLFSSVVIGSVKFIVHVCV